tara:strand:+ start:21 stop:257 length:237 start_codon:yes stop_codon:yes gene_type:complete
MIKKILFWIVLINFFGTFTITLSEIIPLEKPIQSKEQTKKKLFIDVVKPIPKPIQKIVIKEKEINTNIEKKNYWAYTS